MKVVLSCFAFFLATFSAAAIIATRAEPLAGPSGVALYHALAMTSVFLLTVCACSLLLRAGWWTPAVLTATGAAIGPFTLLTPPWSASLSPEAMGAPSTPVVVQAVVGVVVIGWIVLTAHVSIAATSRQRLAHSSAAFGLPLAAVVLALLVWPNGLTDAGHGDLTVRMWLGWALLSSGVVAAGVATARLRDDRSAVVTDRLLPVLAVVAVLAVYGAYTSEGGWPQVAGWAYAQAPLYATIATSAVLVISALIAAAAPEVARFATRLRTPSSPSPSDIAAPAVPLAS